MAQRVRLTWNRNREDETEYYRVFRSESIDIHRENCMEKLIMRVAHPPTINPITVKNEILKRMTSVTYKIAHRHILLSLDSDSFPFILHVNGAEYTKEFTLDIDEGTILFEDPITETDVVKLVEYTFDGVQVWDYEIEEPEKMYYGPEAKDVSKPIKPENLTLVKDYDQNRIVLRWDVPELKGMIFYYRIDAAINASQYSDFTEYKHAILREPFADRPYLVERSVDGIEWHKIARLRENEYFEYMVDRHAPDPVRNFHGVPFLLKNKGKAEIHLRWDAVSDSSETQTALYRIKVQNKVGSYSEPSNVVGPVPFKVALDRVVIRRKEYDGSMPSFDGADAETIVEIDDFTIQYYKEEVDDNKSYIYGIWAVDKAGNYSTLTYAVIEIGDATSPLVPMNLLAEQFQLIVG